MRNIQPLTYGDFFHIYNRGINSCDLFRESGNYEHFLGLYDRYISPVAEAYAWVLMKNHFHLLVRIKDKDEIGFILPKTLSGYKTTERVSRSVAPSVVFHPDGGSELKKYKPSNQFSHLFNAYVQAVNKRFGRTGSLFEHPFKRKRIDYDWYLKTGSPAYPQQSSSSRFLFVRLSQFLKIHLLILNFLPNYEFYSYLLILKILSIMYFILA